MQTEKIQTQIFENSSLRRTFEETKRPGIGYKTPKSERYSHIQRTARQQRQSNAQRQQLQATQELREQANNALYQVAETPSISHPENPQPAIAAQLQKEKNRAGYALRKSEKLNKDRQRLSRQVRINRYNCYHKCSHGLGFNCITVNGQHIAFGCDHDRPKTVLPEVTLPCISCGTICPVVKRTNSCGCISACCPRCKRTTYADTYSNGKIHYQSYEKHSTPGVILTTEGHEDLGQTDFDAAMKEILVETVTDPVSTAQATFASVTKTKRFATRATRKAFFESLRQKDHVETVPEGGMMSSIAAPVGGAVKAVTDKLREVKDKTVKGLKDLTAKTLRIFGAGTAVTTIVKVIKATEYLFCSIIDYILALKPYRLYVIALQAAQNPLLATLIFAEVVSDLQTAEKLAKLSFLQAIDRWSVAEIRKNRPYFHVLNTAIYDYLDNTRNVERQPKIDVLNKVEKMGLFYYYPTPDPNISANEEFEDAVATFPEAGIADVIPGILGIFDQLPRRFGEALSILKNVAKELLPIIMLLRGIGDLTKMCSKLVETIMNSIFDRTKDPKVWISKQIADENSPIHKSVSLFTAYNMAVLNKSSTADSEPLRTEFFESLVDSDKLARESNFFTAWIDLRRKLIDGFNLPPRPMSREFEPTVLVLSGLPSIGKSTIWRAIAGPLVLTGREPTSAYEALEKITHTWNSSSEFQPGMATSKVVVFDDFQQDKTTNVEALNVIHLCTSAPYPICSPNITGPEIKGCFAKPEIVVLCTNLSADFAGQNLASPDALRRRYDIDFEVLKRYDPANPDAPIAKIANCSHYAKLIGKTVNLAQMRVIFATIHKMKRDKFRSVKTMMEDEIKRELEQLMLPLRTDNIANAVRSWQLDRDFERDYEKYVLSGVPDDVQQVVPETDDEDDDADDADASAGPSTGPATAVPPLRHAAVPVRRSTLVPRLVDTSDEPPALEYESGFYEHLAEYKYFASQLLRQGLVFAVPLFVARSFLDVVEMLGNSIRIGPYNAFKKVLYQTTACALKTLGATLLLYTAFKGFGPYLHPESGTTKTAKAARPVATVAEAGEVVDFEILQDVFRKATGSVKRADGIGLNCVFIGGTYILVPKHFFLNLDTLLPIREGMPMTVTKSNWNGTTIGFIYESARLRPIKGHSPAGPTEDGYRSDVILYELPEKVFTAEKKITKFFWDGVGDLTGAKVCKLDYTPADGNKPAFFNDSVGTVSYMQRYTYRLEGQQQIFHILAEADYASRACSCGSLVRKSGQEAPLLGIHVAAGAGKSYFHFVTRSALEQAMVRHQPDVILMDQAVITHAEADYAFNPPNSTLRLEYELPNAVFQPTKTDLQPSLVYEAVGPHTTEPAPLTYADPRLQGAYTRKEFNGELFAKFAKRGGEFSENEISWAVDTMRSDIQRIQSTSMIKTKKLDLHEAINGLPIPCNTSIDMSTSMGWPYTPLKKEEAFDVFESKTQRVVRPRDFIKRDYDKAMKILAEGNIPFLPFVYTLKDERVKIHKVYKPGTRLFACGSVIHFLVCRTYFYTFLMQLYHAPLDDSWSYPSLDRLSLDWHKLMAHMAEVGDLGFDFDFGGWDRRTSHLLIYEAVDLMLTGLDIPLQEKRAVIEMIASPYVIYGKKVYRVNGSVMSGILITFAMNCIINEIIHRTAFYNLAKIHAPVYAEYRAYRANVRGMRGGDDTITVVSDKVSQWFNGATVAQYFITRGLEVTDPSKSEVIVPLRPLLELSFLKNKTRVLCGFYVPLPDFNSLVESCYWMRLNKNNMDALKATQDNCEAALRGLFFYGAKQYNAVIKALLAKEPRLILPSYTELNYIWTVYFYFPGMHSDYASRSLQNNDYRDDAKPKEMPNRDRLSQIVQQHMEHYEIHYEQGRCLTTVSTPRAIQYESGPLPTMVFENSSRRGLDKVATAEKTDYTLAAPEPSRNDPAEEKVVNEDLGSVEKTETTKVGATVQDSAQTSVKTVLTGRTVVKSHNPRAEAYLNDVRWDLEKLLEKFTFIQAVNWNLTQTSGTVLASLRLPEDILRTAAQKAPFDLTKFARFRTITMKVVVKSSPFYSGTLVQGFTPFDLPVDYKRQLNMGASVIKLSQDEGVEFKIPFRFDKGALVVPNDFIGRYTLTVQAPLRTGAANANSVGVSIFASIDGMEFKVPEVIPSVRYASHKLGPNDFVDTMYEAGMTKEQRSTVCDINHPVRDMDCTTLCAGEGRIAKVRVGHFQDQLTDLVTAMKRWRTVRREPIVVGAGQQCNLTFDISELEDIAMGPLTYMFSAFRGSLMIRARILEAVVQGSIIPQTGNARATLALNSASLDFAAAHIYARYDGVHYFDTQSPALICIPYFKNTFITRMGAGNDQRKLLLELLAPHADMRYLVELDICLGDDFHVGIFAGADSNLVDNQTKASVVKINEPIVEAVETQYESGILDFIDRAVETAIPIAQCASELGVLSDAHPVTYQPYPIHPRRVPYGIACDLVNYKETMLTTNHNGMSLPDKDCFGVESHEANIHNLMTNTKSQLDILQWGAGQNTGAVLFQQDVGPTLAEGTGLLHDKLPQMFYYWNGSVKYIFDISASQQHRGQLLFAYTLNAGSPAYGDATQTYFTTFDLSQGRGTICIECPYLSNLPYMRVKTIRDATPNEPTSPGTLTMYVQNPLRSSSTVADTVDIVVYKSYGPDFRLEVFGNLGSIPPPA